jgi:hypothetical protein
LFFVAIGRLLDAARPLLREPKDDNVAMVQLTRHGFSQQCSPASNIETSVDMLCRLWAASLPHSHLGNRSAGFIAGLAEWRALAALQFILLAHGSAGDNLAVIKFTAATQCVGEGAAVYLSDLGANGG